jgi:trans-aconitate methyltransferase
VKIQEAVNLLRNAVYNHDSSQIWLDLGCGTGTFTYALAELLPQTSKIYAVDQYPQHLQQVAGSNVAIEFILSDFESLDMVVDESITGIMMGNSLHYVRDKKRFITELLKRFPAIQQMIIIEYDTKAANQRVPYPVTFLQLTELLEKTKFMEVKKIAERPSVYGQGNMYVVAVH